MDISKKSMFKIGYTSALSSNANNKKIWTSIIAYTRKNKIMIISLVIFLNAVCINFILLYNFFCILEKIN